MSLSIGLLMILTGLAIMAFGLYHVLCLASTTLCFNARLGIALNPFAIPRTDCGPSRG